MQPTTTTTTRLRPRPEKRVGQPVLLYDLDAEINALRRERAYQLHGHNAKTLVKRDHFRIVVTALARGTIMPAHADGESEVVQCLRGAVRVRLNGRVVDLTSGTMITIAPGVRRELEAVEGCALLLTFGWPKG